MKGFKYLGYKAGVFTCFRIFIKEIVSLPMHPYIKTEEIESLVSFVKKN